MNPRSPMEPTMPAAIVWTRSRGSSINTSEHPSVDDACRFAHMVSWGDDGEVIAVEEFTSEGPRTVDNWYARAEGLVDAAKSALPPPPPPSQHWDIEVAAPVERAGGLFYWEWVETGDDPAAAELLAAPYRLLFGPDRVRIKERTR